MDQYEERLRNDGDMNGHAVLGNGSQDQAEAQAQFDTMQADLAAARDQQLRATALERAQETVGETGNPGQVLKAAEQYLAFLKGESAS